MTWNPLIQLAGIDPSFKWSWWGHTCETVPRDEDPKDGIAIDAYHLNIIMAHSLPEVKQHYYQAGAEALTYITDYVRGDYYGKPKNRGKRK